MSTKDKVIEMDKLNNGIESSSKIRIRRSDNGESLKKFLNSSNLQSPGEKDYSTVYHRASEKGSLEVCRSLISEIHPDKMSETINLPNINGETALHIATKKLYPDIIKILLDVKANPNLRDDDGNTPLHHLTKKILCDEYLRERLSESLNLLINQPDADLNPINFNGETPLKLATNLINDNKDQMSDFSKEFVEILITKGSNADDLPDNFSQMFADTIEEASGNSKTLSSPKVLEVKVYNWIAGKNIKEIGTLWKEPSRMKPETKDEIKRLINGRIGSKSILTKVVSDCDEDDVRFLLNELDADPFVKNVGGEIPLNASLSQNNSVITDLLVSMMKEKQDGSFNLDVVQNTNDEVKSYLISKGAYIGNIDGTIKEFLTTKVLQKAFDYSINSYDGVNRLAKKTSNDPDSPDHCVILNYDFLFPSSEKLNEESLKMAASMLLSMANKSEVKEAFKHPLIELFVLLSVSNLSGMLYYWDLVPYLVINALIILSAMIERILINVTVVIMILLSASMIVKEVIKVKKSQWKEYLKKIDNYIKWFTLLGIISLLYYLIEDPLNEDLYMNKVFCHHLGWIMLGSSFVIFSSLGKTFAFARYVAIVKKITWNYLKALIPLSFIYNAFNYCFMIIFAPTEFVEEENNVTGINNYLPYLKTIPKTMVMSSGEFDYSSYSGASEDDPWYIELSSSLILVLFIFFIFMVLTNVFTAIAVGDVEVLKLNLTQSLLTSMLSDICLNEDVSNIFLCHSKWLLKCIPHWLVPFNEPLDTTKVFVRINELSRSDRFIYSEKKKNFISLKYLIEVKTREALRDIYRKRIGADKEIPAYPLPNDTKDGNTELMVRKMEQLQSRLTEMSRNQEKLESIMKENQEKLEFQLKKLIDNMPQ